MISIPFDIHQRRWHLSALTVQAAPIRCQLILKAFDSNQPRVPAGGPDGGQWTRDGEGIVGSSQEDDNIIFVADRDDRRYNDDLREEENRGGHALRDHVGKTEMEMLHRVRSKQYRAYLISGGRRRIASFFQLNPRTISSIELLRQI